MDINIDIEILISEVGKRELIWNTSNEDHKDKNKKNAAWVEICSILLRNYDSESQTQQKLIGKYYFRIILLFAHVDVLYSIQLP